MPLVNSIAVDASGNVYTTGHFAGTADLTLVPGLQILHLAGSNEYVC